MTPGNQVSLEKNVLYFQRFLRDQKLGHRPLDIYFADGFLGQRVYVIPSRDLVVVRMGYSLSNFDLNKFLKEIIDTLPE